MAFFLINNKYKKRTNRKNFGKSKNFFTLVWLGLFPPHFRLDHIHSPLKAATFMFFVFSHYFTYLFFLLVSLVWNLISFSSPTNLFPFCFFFLFLPIYLPYTLNYQRLPCREQNKKTERESSITYLLHIFVFANFFLVLCYFSFPINSHICFSCEASFHFLYLPIFFIFSSCFCQFI